jgi:large subunit ribosomal protein L15
MTSLSSLTNTHRPRKKVQRVGRGAGSKRGKTCGRGVKGYKARTGYSRRYGHEGGQLPLYRKLPCRGFSSGLFKSKVFAVNLERIEELFSEGETVNLASLREKGLAPRRSPGGLKILGEGELKKKVLIEAHHFSASAREKLEKASISFKQLPLQAAS